MQDGAEPGQPADDRPPPIPPAPDGAGAAGAYGRGAGHGPYGSGPYGATGQPPSGMAGQPLYGTAGQPPYGASAHGPGAAYGAGAAYGTGAAYGNGYGYGYGWQGPPLPSGMSTAAMVLGIISLVLTVSCWGAPLGVVTSVIALCLGVGARRRVRRGELGGRGQASAGFVMGIVGLCLSAIVSTLLVIGLVSAADDSDGPGTGPGGGGSDPDSYDARGPVPTLLLER